MNITNADRRKAHETIKGNIAMNPTDDIPVPTKVNAASERTLNGRCFVHLASTTRTAKLLVSLAIRGQAGAINGGPIKALTDSFFDILFRCRNAIGMCRSYTCVLREDRPCDER